jgi:hypothetical protein
LSFDKRPTGESQEHILERRPANKARGGVMPALGDFGEVALTVIAINEESVGENFHALTDI